MMVPYTILDRGLPENCWTPGPMDMHLLIPFCGPLFVTMFRSLRISCFAKAVETVLGATTNTFKESFSGE